MAEDIVRRCCGEDVEWRRILCGMVEGKCGGAEKVCGMVEGDWEQGGEVVRNGGGYCVEGRRGAAEWRRGCAEGLLGNGNKVERRCRMAERRWEAWRSGAEAQRENGKR